MQTEKPLWISPQEYERLFGIPTGSLANARSKGVGVPYTRFGKLIRYKLSDVEAAFEAGRVETSATGREG